VGARVFGVEFCEALGIDFRYDFFVLGFDFGDQGVGVIAALFDEAVVEALQPMGAMTASMAPFACS